MEQVPEGRLKLHRQDCSRSGSAKALAFPTRFPYNFRATICGISLLTDTTGGSTLSIPEYFFGDLFLKEAATRKQGRL